MLTNFFDKITQASVRWRVATIVLTFIVLGLGGYAFTQLNQELLPPVEFPQTILVAQWPDSESTDQFLDEVTEPLEQAFQAVEGVVNVESNTNQTLSVFIVRNSFGENQDKIREDIEAAAQATSLPEGVEPEVFTFSLSDLPVVIASVTSAELSLGELKALIESDLKPELESIEIVSEVAINGGQELPEAEANIQRLTSLNVRTQKLTFQTEYPADDPGNLSPLLVLGLRSYDLDVSNARDVPPEGARAVIYAGEALAMQALGLFTTENLLVAQPATLAYIPSDYATQLDAALVTELNELSAEFGGIGQFSFDDIAAAEADGLDVLTGQPLEAGTVATLGLASAESPQPALISEPTTGIPLPEAWITAVGQQGLTIATTDDLSAELITQLAAAAPQMLDMLTPDMLLAMPLDALAALPTTYLAQLDPSVQAQLAERAGITAPEPALISVDSAETTAVGLPPEWVEGMAQQGFDITTTADLTPELVSQIADFAPQMLDSLTPDMLLAMPLNVLAVLPPTYLAELDPAVQAQLAERAGVALPQPMAESEAPTEEIMPAADAVALPETWVAMAETQGLAIATTADLSPELVTGIAQFAPEMLNELTPEMLLATSPATLGALPPEFFLGLDEDVQAQLAERVVFRPKPPHPPQPNLKKTNPLTPPY